MQQCKLCGATFKFNSSTSSLRYHLNNLHVAISSPSQPTIAAVVGRRVCDHRKAEGITQRICGMIERDMMPISTTEGEGFRELIQFMEPGYNIPSRATITSHLEARYKNKKAKLKTLLSAANVALTTDC